MSSGERAQASYAAPSVGIRLARLRLPFGSWLWAVTLASGAMFGGALIDAWSHVHEPALDPVFNAWHLPVYVSFTVLIALLLLPSAGRYLSGHPVHRVVPRTTRVALVGAATFVVAGLADTVWHAAFGMEVGVEALLSPTHLMLAVGAALLWSVPLQLAWQRRSVPGRLGFGPALMSFGLIVGLLSFTTHFAHPFVDPWPSFTFDERSATSWFVPSLGFAALVMQTAITSAATLVMLRRWPKPVHGSLLVVFTLSGTGLAFLHDQPHLALVPIVGGAIAEVAWWALRPTPEIPSRMRLFATLVPAVQAIAYLAVLAATDEVRWSAHLAGGLVAVAGLTGYIVSLVVFSPVESRWSQDSRLPR